MGIRSIFRKLSGHDKSPDDVDAAAKEVRLALDGLKEARRNAEKKGLHVWYRLGTRLGGIQDLSVEISKTVTF